MQIKGQSSSRLVLGAVLLMLCAAWIAVSGEVVAAAATLKPQSIYYVVYGVSLIFGTLLFWINFLVPQKQGVIFAPLIQKWINVLWSERYFLPLVFLFGLGVRVLFAVQLTLHLPPGVMGGPDSAYNDDARLLVSSFGHFLDPTLPFLSQKGSVVLFYTLIYKIFGYDPLIARLFNALLGAVCVLLTYSIAKIIFDERAAKWAAMLSAGYGFLIQYGGYIGSEAFGLFAIELFVWAAFMALRRHGRSALLYALFSGSSLTLLVMARPEYYYALLPFLIWVGYLFRKNLPKLGWFMVGFGVIALPWMYRNYLTFGDFVLSSIVSDTVQIKGELLHQTWLYEINQFRDLGFPVVDFKSMVIETLKHPVHGFQILWPHVWGQFHQFWTYDTFFTPAFIFIQPKSCLYNLLLSSYLYFLMVVGAFVGMKRPELTSLLIFVILFKTISYLLTTSSTMFDPLSGTFSAQAKDWYRFTIVPLTHIFMGGGIMRFFASLRMTTPSEGQSVFPPKLAEG